MRGGGGEGEVTYRALRKQALDRIRVRQLLGVRQSAVILSHGSIGEVAGLGDIHRPQVVGQRAIVDNGLKVGQTRRPQRVGAAGVGGGPVCSTGKVTSKDPHGHAGSLNTGTHYDEKEEEGRGKRGK